MADFNIKQGDTSPDLVSTLKGADGVAVDLTGADVRFIMTPRGETDPTIDGVADIDADPETGIVSYQWAEGDTEAAGLYDAEFEVTFVDYSVQTFPNSGYLRIQVLRQLG